MSHYDPHHLRALFLNILLKPILIHWLINSYTSNKYHKYGFQILSNSYKKQNTLSLNFNLWIVQFEQQVNYKGWIQQMRLVRGKNEETDRPIWTKDIPKNSRTNLLRNALYQIFDQAANEYQISYHNHS